MGGRRNDNMNFWRDADLPYIEARVTRDGRGIGYAKHSHDTFSIGAVTGGQSLYWHQKAASTVTRGSVVLMNPHEIHACNPLTDRPWSYCMLYVEPAWLVRLQHSLGCAAAGGFRHFATYVSQDPVIFRGLLTLCVILMDPRQTTSTRDARARAFFTGLHRRLALVDRHATGSSGQGLSHAASFMREHCTQPLRLADVSAIAGVSSAYLVRCFKQQYGITPYAFLTDCRIRHGQVELKRGRPIADVALECQFADQPHFQRTFKRFTAVTPRQYIQVTSG
ncbi:AraC family transcriptional regulator [Halomonas sp. WWR20]